MVNSNSSQGTHSTVLGEESFSECLGWSEGSAGLLILITLTEVLDLPTVGCTIP